MKKSDCVYEIFAVWFFKTLFILKLKSSFLLCVCLCVHAFITKIGYLLLLWYLPWSLEGSQFHLSVLLIVCMYNICWIFSHVFIHNVRTCRRKKVREKRRPKQLLAAIPLHLILQFLKQLDVDRSKTFYYLKKHIDPILQSILFD